MKITTSLKATLTGLFAASLLTACGAEQLTSLSSALDNSNLQSFSVAGRGQTAPGFAADGQPGQRGGKGMKGGPGGHGGFQLFFGPELELTEEQQSQLQALRESLKPADDNTRPDQSQLQAFKTQIEAAFVSDTFDVSTLEAQINANRPDPEARLSAEAEVLIKSWAILTADQKATVKSKQAEMSAKFAEMAANRPEPPADSERPERVNPLVEKLNLTTEQQAALEALKPERPDTATAPTDVASAVIAELESGSATAASLATILKSNRPEVAKSPLSQLAELHAILSAEQRQAFVDAGLLMAGPGGPGGKAGHAGPGGANGGFGGGFGGPGKMGGKMGHGPMGAGPEAAAPDFNAGGY